MKHFTHSRIRIWNRVFLLNLGKYEHAAARTQADRYVDNVVERYIRILGVQAYNEGYVDGCKEGRTEGHDVGLENGMDGY